MCRQKHIEILVIVLVSRTTLNFVFVKTWSANFIFLSSLQESLEYHSRADQGALKDGSREYYSYWDKNLLFTFIGPTANHSVSQNSEFRAIMADALDLFSTFLPTKRFN